MPRHLFFILTGLCAGAGLVAAPARRVEIVAAVPPVTQVDAPGEIDLAPGETRVVHVRVACNQSWLVSLRTDNPHIRPVGRRVGAPGGMSAAGHDFTVQLACSPNAPGPQSAQLAAQIITGPFVAGLAN
jgi:hypothetical protein